MTCAQHVPGAHQRARATVFVALAARHQNPPTTALNQQTLRHEYHSCASAGDRTDQQQSPRQVGHMVPPTGSHRIPLVWTKDSIATISGKPLLEGIPADLAQSSKRASDGGMLLSLTSPTGFTSMLDLTIGQVSRSDSSARDEFLQQLRVDCCALISSSALCSAGPPASNSCQHAPEAQHFNKLLLLLAVATHPLPNAPW